MSLSASNIISPNLIALENTVSNQSSQIQKLIDVFQDKNNREYDYVTKQDVSVSFIVFWSKNQKMMFLCIKRGKRIILR